MFSVGHLYILVATDYFSNLAEVITLEEAKKVLNFTRMHIIY